jgi:hypothetical protein
MDLRLRDGEKMKFARRTGGTTLYLTKNPMRVRQTDPLDKEWVDTSQGYTQVMYCVALMPTISSEIL